MLSLILNWLGGGVLKSVLGHLEKRKELELGENKLKTEVTIEEIRAQLETRREQAGIIKAELGHWIAWLPRFLAAMTAVIYFMSVVIDTIWELPGEIKELPASTAAVMATIFAGMFLQGPISKAGDAIKNLRGR
jgi:hypothetical protein